ncbi:MAG TPA: c-type cytochrome domain-containing protein [Methylomirabilota bacterium]|nr:c-type cytochrome domain-containing protein [Methylomirabilota bacterium]
MKKFAIALGMVAFVSLLIPAAGAAEPDVSKLPAAADRPIAFEKDIKPIFEASCAECHGPKRQKSKYRLDDPEIAVKGGSSGEAAIIPGTPEKSVLLLQAAGLIKDMEMPPVENRDRFPQLTPEQLGLIRAWIAQGAKFE